MTSTNTNQPCNQPDLAGTLGSAEGRDEGGVGQRAAGVVRRSGAELSHAGGEDRAVGVHFAADGHRTESPAYVDGTGVRTGVRSVRCAAVGGCPGAGRDGWGPAGTTAYSCRPTDAGRSGSAGGGRIPGPRGRPAP